MENDREGRWLRFWSKEMKGNGDGEEKGLGWFSRGAGLEVGMEADKSGERRVRGVVDRGKGTVCG